VIFDPLFRFNKDIRDVHGKLNSTSDLYDPELLDIARQVFIEKELNLVEGFYCYFPLPNYETPAEI
jgi:purine-nucleoside phosphorylase